MTSSKSRQEETMKRSAVVLALLLLSSVSVFGQIHRTPSAVFGSGSPKTTDNDNACDIGLYPAATLLLPNFEVDIQSPATSALTTLVTITNVSNVPQIAHFTIWTDRGFPVLDFNVFLTGYDVQAMNLYDVIARGVIAAPSGTSSNSVPGSRSNSTNPNLTSLAGCALLPGPI